MERLITGTKVFVHDPNSTRLIYRRGYVIGSSLDKNDIRLYDIYVSKRVVRGLIREQLLDSEEMAQRRAKGL